MPEDMRRSFCCTRMFGFSRMLPLNSAWSSLLQVCGFFVAGRVCLLVLAIALPVVNSFLGPYHSLLLPPSFVLPIGWCVVIVNGAIAAMSFLPPVREVFAIQS
jgi:hypothetical protein